MRRTSMRRLRIEKMGDETVPRENESQDLAVAIGGWESSNICFESGTTSILVDMICNSCGSEWPTGGLVHGMFGSARGCHWDVHFWDPCQPATDTGKRRRISKLIRNLEERRVLGGTLWRTEGKNSEDTRIIL